VAGIVEFRLLGPLEVRVDGAALRLGGPKQQVTLALMVVNAGRSVSLADLIDELWPESPPPSAVDNARQYAANLRRMFESSGGGQRPVRHGSGYVFRAEADEVDLRAFEEAAAAGCEALRRGDPATAVRKLEDALAYWRGPMLAGLPLGPMLAARCEAAEGERLAVTEELAEALLASGEHGPVARLMREHVRKNPLRERAYALLMRSLYGGGDVADAIAVYGQARATLAEELGIEPGRELQDLHRSMLNRDGNLDRGESQQRRTMPPVVPAQLPAAISAFVGREDSLKQLDAQLSQGASPAAVVITAIDGMAGVGKTALAVQAAHQMVDRYPDGQLFIDLHGYTHGVTPIEPGEALDRMLRSLGVPGERIPAGLDERAGLYRSRLADQRMLVVLDNAATETQVTPLLPGAPGCLVLITSRRRLAGLDHTHTLSLDTLPPDDAVTLLRHTVGDSRLAGESTEVVTELVDLCGRLPLAIRIAAARLRSHPSWGLAHLVRRLRDHRHRLGELAAGQRSVAVALDLSYQDLSAGQQRTYRLLGLHPGADFDVYAVTALLDSTLLEAGRLLEQLLDSHLLQEPVPGRYRFHDLIRAHAAHTATRDETEEGARVALDRLLDYYRHTAAVAMDAAYPYERERRPQISPARTPSPVLSDSTAALGWLDGELPNLLAAAGCGTEHGRQAHLLHLSSILHLHLRSRGHHHDAVTLHQLASTVARATGHQAAELDALAGLGHIHRLEGRYEPATDNLGRALQLARATGHLNGELDALTGLGNVHRMQGRYEQATDHYQQALQLARTAGHRSGGLGALIGLGHVYRRQGRYEQATDHYQQALHLAHTTGHRNGELQALTDLSHIYRLQGRYEQATDHYQRLLDLAHERGDRNWQFEARQGLGRLHHATGHPDAALTHHHQALALATELGQPDDQARAHDGLAHAHHALHHHEQARTHWQHALHILTRLGIDHTDEEDTTVAIIRTHLANPDRHKRAASKE
jgi:DNA-binding SARP family transcriptional activator/tetratricopeptide (TPR) repeat protein